MVGRTLFYDDVNGQFVERQSFQTHGNISPKAISGDIAVEANFGSQNVRVYQLQEGVWNITQTFTSDELDAGDGFGETVDIDGDSIIVGAYGDDDLGEDAGAAYVFKRGMDGQFNQNRKLTSPTGGPNQNFGGYFAIGISGQTALVFQPNGTKAHFLVV